jgi:mono/diheme cytochrome c family protein
MRTQRLVVSVSLVTAIAAAAALVACGGDASSPHVVGKTPEAIGKYLVTTGGCNDCHTPGVMQGINVPEERWLIGLPVGFRGPWGTSYPTNLRRSVEVYTQESFVKTMKTRNANPPMPWSALHAMTDEDLGAIYAYIRSLGPAGDPAPKALPPGQEPTTPYIVMEPVMPKGFGLAATTTTTSPAR